MKNAEKRFFEALQTFAQASEDLLISGAPVEAIEEMIFGPIDMPSGFPVQLAFHNPYLQGV